MTKNVKKLQIMTKNDKDDKEWKRITKNDKE